MGGAIALSALGLPTLGSCVLSGGIPETASPEPNKPDAGNSRPAWQLTGL